MIQLANHFINYLVVSKAFAADGSSRWQQKAAVSGQPLRRQLCRLFGLPMQELHWILDLNSPKVPNYYRVWRLEYDVWVWANDIEAAETLMAAGATDVLFDATLEGFQRGLRYALSDPRAAA